MTIHRPGIWPFALLALILSGCTNKGYDKTEMDAAIQIFDQEAKKVSYAQNAGTRFLSIAKSIGDFPDSKQAVDTFCKRGLPKNHGHLKNWHERHTHLIPQLDEILDFKNYALSYEDITRRNRHKDLEAISHLLFVDAALKEKYGTRQELLAAMRNVYRYSAMVSRDAFVNDYYLSWNIQRKINLMLKRLIHSFSEDELKQVVLMLEHHASQVSGLQHYMKRKKQFTKIMIHLYLRPDAKDGMMERMGLPTASELLSGTEDVFELQDKLLDKKMNLFQKDIWKDLNAELETVTQKDTFYQMFFGYRDSSKTSYLQTINYYISMMVLYDELQQLQAMWLIKKKTMPATKITMNTLLTGVKQLHEKEGIKRRENGFVDPFTDKPFGFRIGRHETAFWSIGPDLKDTEGLFEWDAFNGRGDIVIKLNHKTGKKTTP